MTSSQRGGVAVAIPMEGWQIGEQYSSAPLLTARGAGGGTRYGCHARLMRVIPRGWRPSNAAIPALSPRKN